MGRGESDFSPELNVEVQTGIILAGSESVPVGLGGGGVRAGPVRLGGSEVEVRPRRKTGKSRAVRDKVEREAWKRQCEGTQREA